MNAVTATDRSLICVTDNKVNINKYKTVNLTVFYRFNTFNDDVTNFDPALEGQHFKQRLHGIADVIKVKVTRVRPGQTFTTRVLNK